MRPEDILLFDRRMNDLDVEHSRARSPAQRKRVERKMRQLRADVAELKVAEAKFEKEYKVWWENIERRFAVVLGSTDPNRRSTS